MFNSEPRLFYRCKLERRGHYWPPRALPQRKMSLHVPVLALLMVDSTSCMLDVLAKSHRKCYSHHQQCYIILKITAQQSYMDSRVWIILLTIVTAKCGFVLFRRFCSFICNGYGGEPNDNNNVRSDFIYSPRLVVITKTQRNNIIYHYQRERIGTFILHVLLSL